MFISNEKKKEILKDVLMSEQTIEMIMEGLEYDGTLDKLENTLTDSSNLWQDVEDEMTEMLTDSLKTLLNSRRL